MLVEFRIKNYRSLRDEQVFSMVASADKAMQGTHVMDTGLKAVPRVLRSAVLYGANASGKSNLIKALQYMRKVVLRSATWPPDARFSVQPFLLDKESAVEPTEFELTFIMEGVRHQYGFAMTQERIVSEYLLVYRAFKPQRWFERYYDAAIGKDVYEFGAGLKGAKAVWEQATRPNALFLSTAVQLNSEALRPVFEWIRNGLVIFNEQAPLSPFTSLKMLQDQEGKRRICDFLSAADISIADIELIEQPSTDVADPINKLSFAEDTPKELRALVSRISEVLGESRMSDELAYRVQFFHATEHGNTTLDLEDESSGTRNLLFLAGPILDVLKSGRVLVIDELDTSLHPLLVRELVRMFLRPEINTGGAQLVFTTHDTSLLAADDLLRRDQVWFVEKDADQASSLVALAEYSPRKNEALERGYLMGRYGGIPFLQGGLEGIH